MEQDLATLQLISNTLKEDPNASQRVLAKKNKCVIGNDECDFETFCRTWLDNAYKRE